jgi:hypothetical protein
MPRGSSMEYAKPVLERSRGTSRASSRREQLEPQRYVMESTTLSPFESGRRVSLHELERWTSLAAASAVIAYGFSRRTVPGAVLAVAATPIAYKGIVGRWPFNNGHAADDTRSALAGSKGIHVHESIRLETPVAEVYRFWRNLENLPRFLSPSRKRHRARRWTLTLGREWAGRRQRRVGRRDHQRSREQGHRLAIASGIRCHDRRDRSTSPPCAVGVPLSCP